MMEKLKSIFNWIVDKLDPIAEKIDGKVLAQGLLTVLLLLVIFQVVHTVRQASASFGTSVSASWSLGEESNTGCNRLFQDETLRESLTGKFDHLGIQAPTGAQDSVEYVVVTPYASLHDFITVWPNEGEWFYIVEVSDACGSNWVYTQDRVRAVEDVMGLTPGTLYIRLVDEAAAEYAIVYVDVVADAVVYSLSQ